MSHKGVNVRHSRRPTATCMHERAHGVCWGSSAQPEMLRISSLAWHPRRVTTIPVYSKVPSDLVTGGEREGVEMQAGTKLEPLESVRCSLTRSGPVLSHT